MKNLKLIADYFLLVLTACLDPFLLHLSEVFSFLFSLGVKFHLFLNLELIALVRHVPQKRLLEHAGQFRVLEQLLDLILTHLLQQVSWIDVSEKALVLNTLNLNLIFTWVSIGLIIILQIQAL